MKKFLLLFVTFVSITAFAQPCIPDPQFTAPGIYPDSATGLAPACVGEVYNQVITNIIPVDTCIQVFPLPVPCVTTAFDSIVITNFTGLPPSLSYVCATSLGGCSFAGGEAGCVLISGTPLLAEIGTHSLVITVDVYVGGLGSPSATQDIDWYFIDVLPAGSCTSGISEESASNINLFPNPTENTLTIDGLSASTESITITNTSGQVMSVYNDVNSTSLEVNVQNLESGIYFVRINNNDASNVIRFVKK